MPTLIPFPVTSPVIVLDSFLLHDRCLAWYNFMKNYDFAMLYVINVSPVQISFVTSVLELRLIGK